MKIKVNTDILHDQMRLLADMSVTRAISEKESTLLDGMYGLLRAILYSAESGDWIEFERSDD